VALVLYTECTHVSSSVLMHLDRNYIIPFQLTLSTRGLIRPTRDTFSFLVVFCRRFKLFVYAQFCTDEAHFCGEHVLLLISRDPISGLHSSCYSRIYRPVSVTDIAWLLVLRASYPSLRDRIRCRFEKVVAVGSLIFPVFLDEV